MTCQSVCKNIEFSHDIVIGLFVINTYKNYGKKHIADDSFLTIVGSCSSIFGGIRFVWTWIVDKYSFKLSYTIVLCMNIVFGFTLVLVSDSKPLYLIWVCMIVWAEGAHFGLVPTACALFFGEHAAVVYGVMFSFGVISQITSTFMVRYLLNTIGYESFYYLASGLSLLSLFYLFFLFEEKKVC